MVSVGIPLIILTIIFLMIGLAYLLSQNKRKQKKFKRKRTPYFKLMLYIIVLLISMVFVLIIPVEQERAFEAENLPNLHAMAYEGKLNDRAKDFLVYQKEIPFEDNQLNIRSALSGYNVFDIYVLVEEKDVEDSLVEAFLYQTPTVFDGIDVTKEIEPYQIELTSNALSITAQDNHLSYAIFKTEFPFSQFEENRVPMFEEELIAGEHLVFLRIPQSIQIHEDEQINLHYVKKD